MNTNSRALRRPDQKSMIQESAEEAHSVTEQVTTGDPDGTLDADLAAWFDQTVRVPRVALLGPISATAYGNPWAVAKGKPRYVELLACLALHPHGVPAMRLAEDFHARRAHLRTLVSNLRRWLGADRAGGQYVPHAAPVTASGVLGYRVRGVLIDTSLFDRLTGRARRREASGSDATLDLVTALRLVRGTPLTDPRHGGWSWLFDRERTDQIVNTAVAETAHTVTIRSLESEDYGRAHWAARVGSWAAPDDEKARDDLLITECMERERSRLRVLTDYVALRSSEQGSRTGQRS